VMLFVLKQLVAVVLAVKLARDKSSDLVRRVRSCPQIFVCRRAFFSLLEYTGRVRYLSSKFYL